MVLERSPTLTGYEARPHQHRGKSANRDDWRLRFARAVGAGYQLDRIALGERRQRAHAAAFLAAGKGRRFGRALLAAIGALALAGCNGSRNAYVPPPPPKVVVAQPVQQPVTLYLELTGNTQAFNSVDLVARVQGYLESIDYKDGAIGDQRDSSSSASSSDVYQAQLDQANAALVTAEATIPIIRPNISGSRRSAGRISPARRRSSSGSPRSTRRAAPSPARRRRSNSPRSTSATRR